jgi:hypothetical protein
LKQMIILMAMCLLVFGVSCSREEVKDAADKAGTAMKDTVDEGKAAADEAAKAAKEAAHDVTASAKEATAGAAGGAVATCRSLAKSGDWDNALAACKKAHEMMPDDLALEHAYQQALAASK